VITKRSLNTNADALSRINTWSRVDALNPVEITGKERRIILFEYHDAPLGGHRGMNKTYKAIKAGFHWSNMRQEIGDYVKKCKSCQINKLLGPKNKAPMEITTTADRPFDKCCLDIVGPLPETGKGSRYILTFQDDLRKLVTAIPILQQDAETIDREFVINVTLKMGTPKQVLTDQGANFLSDIFKNVCKLLKIKKLQTTAFRPESDGSLNAVTGF
jgi:hypothetical protein